MFLILIGLALLTSFCSGPSKETLQQYEQAATLFNTNQKAQAQQALDKLLREDEDFLPAHILMGKLSFYEQKYSAALQSFERALAIDSESIDALFWRSRARIMLADKDQHQLNAVLEDLDQILTRDSMHWEAWYYKGLLHERAGQVDQAMAAYQTAARQTSRISLVYLQMGSLYEKARLYKKADQNFTQAARLNGDPATLQLIQKIRASRPTE